MEHGASRGQRWHGHPVVARLIRVAIFVVPFLTAMGVAFFLSSRLPVSSSLSITVVRWLSIVVVSTLAMTAVDRLARRFLPLSVLLRLTLVFPDQAPSRFAIAMRTGTTAQLRRRLEVAREVPEDETPQQAAERLLELVGLLSHHDRLTRGHSERVRAYSHLIGEEMGLTPNELDKLRWAGLLHDVGKTAIATSILNKPGKLTDAEYEKIKSHPEEGRALVAPLADWLGESVRAVWEHHERFDGNGYPNGLSGTHISFAARVVSVADSYDVMTSARSYKQPMSAAAARAELAACSGTQFDPIVVRSFLNISLGRLRLMTGPLAWVAQLALFEPSGVVHAGSSSLPSGSGAAGGTAGSTGAATAGVAASTGTAGVASTVAATAASVVISTAGVVAASPTPAERPETVAVEQAAAGEADDVDNADLAAPDDAVAVLDAAGNVRFTSTTSSSVPAASTGAFVSSDTPDESGDSSETGAAEPESGDPGGGTSEADPASGPTVTATTDPTIPTTNGPAPTTAPPRSTTTTTTLPATTTTTTLPATTTTTTTTTTATTTTTTLPATTTTTTVPDRPVASTYYLGDIAWDTPAPWSHNIVESAPADISLPNFDTDRDAAPGALIVKDAAGIGGSDPTKLLRFSGGFASTLDIDADVHVDLYAAAKDFGRKDLDVQVGIYECGALTGCSLIDSDTREYKTADSWTRTRFHFHDMQTTIATGEWIEVRVAVLDSSEDDGWFAFGTADYDSRIRIADDDD